MSSKLYDLLKGSSLRGLLSNAEIEEVYEELSSDFNDFIEEETERLSDEVKGTTEIKELEEEVKSLELELSKAIKNGFPSKTLNDVMTSDWVKENWESITYLYNKNKTGKEIVNTYDYGETVMEMGREGAPEISKAIDKEIIKNVSDVDFMREFSESRRKSGATSELIRVFEPQPSMEEMIASIHPEVERESEIIAKYHDEFMEQKAVKHKRIVLVGRAASGKDHMRKQLEAKGYVYATSFTTRPPRTGEVEGVDYFFLSPEKFQSMIDNNEFYEYVSFNGWFYGTSNEQFFRDDIFIMTPHGISCIKPEDRKDSFIMYFDMKEGVRRRRLMERSDADKVDRRLEADNLDFADFKDFDVRFTNHDF